MYEIIEQILSINEIHLYIYTIIFTFVTNDIAMVENICMLVENSTHLMIAILMNKISEKHIHI